MPEEYGLLAIHISERAEQQNDLVHDGDSHREKAERNCQID
jgi:hypothetical protein